MELLGDPTNLINDEITMQDKGQLKRITLTDGEIDKAVINRLF